MYLKSPKIHTLGGGARMGETVVYGGVEGGGTHSTVMIFDKVNI